MKKIGLGDKRYKSAEMEERIAKAIESIIQVAKTEAVSSQKDKN